MTSITYKYTLSDGGIVGPSNKTALSLPSSFLARDERGLNLMIKTLPITIGKAQLHCPGIGRNADD